MPDKLLDFYNKLKKSNKTSAATYDDFSKEIIGKQDLGMYLGDLVMGGYDDVPDYSEFTSWVDEKKKNMQPPAGEQQVLPTGSPAPQSAGTPSQEIQPVTTEPTPSQQPLISIPSDPFDLAKRYKALKARKSTTPVVQGGITPTLTKQEDDELNQIGAKIKELGIEDSDMDWMSELPSWAKKGIPASVKQLGIDNPENDMFPVLMQFKKEMPTIFNRQKSIINNRDLFYKQIGASQSDEEKKKWSQLGNDYQRIVSRPISSIDQLDAAVADQISLVNANLPASENISKARDQVKDEKGMFYNEFMPGFDARFANNLGLNKNEFAALQEMKAFDKPSYDAIVTSLMTPIPAKDSMPAPDKSPSLNLDPEERLNVEMGETRRADLIKTTQLGLEQARYNLNVKGRLNAYNFALEQQYRNAKIAQNMSLSKEERDAAATNWTKWKAKADELKADQSNDRNRYPNVYKNQDIILAKELLDTSDKNFLTYGLTSGVEKLATPFRGLTNVLVQSFGSEQQKANNRMLELGQASIDQAEQYLPSSLQTEKPEQIYKTSPEVQAQIDRVKALDMPIEAKAEMVGKIFEENQNDVGLVVNPEAGKSAGVLSMARLYSNIKVVADIAGLATGTAIAASVGIPPAVANALVFGLDVQQQSYKERLAAGDYGTAFDGSVKDGIIIAAAASVGGALTRVKNALAITDNAAIKKAVNGLTEQEWSRVISKYPEQLMKMKSSLGYLAKEVPQAVLTMGVGATAAQMAAEGAVTGKEVDTSDIIRQSFNAGQQFLLDSGLLFGFGGVMNYRNGGLSPAAKENMLAMATQPELATSNIMWAFASGRMTKESAEQAIKVVDQLVQARKSIGLRNEAGEYYTDKELAGLVYRKYMKAEAENVLKTASKEQAAEIEPILRDIQSDEQALASGATDKQVTTERAKTENNATETSERQKQEIDQQGNRGEPARTETGKQGEGEAEKQAADASDRNISSEEEGFLRDFSKDQEDFLSSIANDDSYSEGTRERAKANLAMLLEDPLRYFAKSIHNSEDPTLFKRAYDITARKKAPSDMSMLSESERAKYLDFIVEGDFDSADKMLQDLDTADSTTISMADMYADERPDGVKVDPKYSGLIEKARSMISSIGGLLANQGKNLKVVFHNTPESFKRAALKSGASESDAVAGKGFYVSQDGSAHINLSNMKSDTLPHEMIHPLLDFIADNSPTAIDAMYNQLLKTSIGKDFETAAARSYGTGATGKIEAITDFFARVGSGAIKINPSNFDAIKNAIYKVLSLVGFKDMSKKLIDIKDDNELRRMANLVSGKLVIGDRITTSDIASIYLGDPADPKAGSGFVDSNGNPISNEKIQFSLNNNFSDWISGITYEYLSNLEEFEKLKQGEDALMTEDKTISDFNGLKLMFHQPDAMFSGNVITKEGLTLIEGSGGIFFPIKFRDLNAFWASTANTANTMVEHLNSSMNKNGKIYLALTSAPSDKLFSSTDAARGILSLFQHMSGDPKTPTVKKESFRSEEDYNKFISQSSMIGREEFIKTIISAATSATESTKKNKKGEDVIVKVGLGNYLNIKDLNVYDKNGVISEGLVSEAISKINDALDPEKSIFPDRKDFVVRLINDVADIINDNANSEDPKVRQKAEDAKTFFGNMIYSENAMNNAQFAGRPKGTTIKKAEKAKKNQEEVIPSIYTISRANMRDAIAYMLQEPMLRNAESSEVYAVIEIDGRVKSIDSKAHPSYPKMIVAESDKSKIKLHILKDRQKYWDVIVDPDGVGLDLTTRGYEKATKEEQEDIRYRRSQIFPSTGVTSRGIEIRAEKPSVQFSKEEYEAQRSEIDKEAKASGTYLKAPNGQESALGPNQWTTVRTDAFKNFFGDWENAPQYASDLVDKNGEPMVLYHGSKQVFDEMQAKYADSMIFLTPNPEFAGKWMEGDGGIRTRKTGESSLPAFEEEYRNWKEENPMPENEQEYEQWSKERNRIYNLKQNADTNLYPVFADSKTFDPLNDAHFEMIKPALIERYGSEAEMNKMIRAGGIRSNWFHYETPEVTKALKRLGFTGIWLSEKSDQKPETVALFNGATQVKSAIANAGDFNRENRKLQFSKEEYDRQVREITSKAKADGTFLKAPNGEDSKLNEKQWASVRTDNFKNWYGDWEGNANGNHGPVDSNGEPVIFYHGTEEKFDEFNHKTKNDSSNYYDIIGFYFTYKPPEYKGVKGKSPYGNRTIPAFLNIRKPIVIPNEMVDPNPAWKTKPLTRNEIMSFIGDLEPLRGAGKSKSEIIEPLVNSDKIQNQLLYAYKNFFSRFEVKDGIELFSNRITEKLGYDGALMPHSKYGVAFHPNQIKSATENIGVFNPADARIQFSREEPSRKVEWFMSPEGKGDPAISEKNPIVKQSAINLKAGLISNEEHRAVIAANSPVTKITKFFEPATKKQILNALDEDKIANVDKPIKDGTIVGSRLDIPAYKNKNTWVTSVHEGNTNQGKVLSYTNVAMLDNVKFGVQPYAALNIAGETNKTTIARMFGAWKNIEGKTMEKRGENAKKMVESIIDDPNWVQIGMNPFRHSYFYDRSNDMGRPVIAADRVIQIGGLVYAEKPVYANWNDEMFTVESKGQPLRDSQGSPVKFSKEEIGDFTENFTKIEKLPVASGVNAAVFSPKADPQFSKVVYDETGFVSTGYWVDRLKNSDISYLDGVAKHILEARETLKSGTVPEDNVIKSYLITMASMGSGGGYYENWKQGKGVELNPVFIESNKGKAWVRPEGTGAAYLVTDSGKNLVEAIKNKTATLDDIKKMFEFVGVGRENSKAELVLGSMSNNAIQEFTNLLNANKGSNFNEILDGSKMLNGIGNGKAGFISQFLGISSRAVVDARELNAWIAGGMKLTPAQNEAKRKAEGSQKMQDDFVSRIEQVGKELGYTDDMAGYLAHHAIWDNIAGSKTTHEGEYQVVKGKVQFSKEIGDREERLRTLFETGKITESEYNNALAKLGPFTSTKNAVVNKERMDRGLPTLATYETRDWDQLKQEAEKKISTGEFQPEKVAADVIKNARVLSDWENAAMLIHRVNLSNQRNALLEAIDRYEKNGNTEDAQRAYVALGQVEDAINDNDLASRAAGSEAGRALAARRMQMAVDYSLVAMERRLRAANGGQPLSVDQIKLVQDLDAKLKDAQKKIEDYESMMQAKTYAQTVEEAVKKAPPAPKAEKETTVQTKKASILSRLKEKFKNKGPQMSVVRENLIPEEAHADIKALFKEYVEAGYRDPLDIAENILNDVSEIFDGISERDIMDTISGYGKTTEPSADEVSRAITDLKGQMRVISGLEDVSEGMRPAKSGYQRQEPSDQLRQMRQTLHDAMKEANFQDETSDKEYKTALDRVKKRLKNQIADLENQIATGDRRETKNKPIEKDQEANDLLKERDRLREQMDLIDKSSGAFDERKARQVEYALQRQIDDYERRINDKDFSPKKSDGTIDNEKISELKGKRDALREEFNQLKEDLGIAETNRIEAYKKNIQKRILDYQTRIANGDFAAKEKKQKVLDDEAVRLKSQLEDVKYEFEKAKLAAERKNRSTTRKVIDKAQYLRRAILLSSIGTLGKIGTAGLMLIGTKPMEEMVGSVLRILPGVREVAKGAPREGAGFQPKVEAKALTQLFKEATLTDWRRIMQGKQSEMETAYGTKVVSPEEREFFGQLHSVIKYLPKKSEIFRSMEKRFEFYAQQGLDISSDAVKSKVISEAILDGNRSIFMGDNKLIDAYKSFVKTLERGEDFSSKAGAEAVKFLLPIIKVPTNYVKSTAEYLAGGVKAGIMLRNGIESLSPNDKDIVMRLLKKQALGAAFLAIGILNPDNVGGYYSGRREDEDLEAGTLRVNGVDIPRWMTHAPLVEVMQFGATIRRNLDKQAEEGEIVGASAKAMAAAEAGLELAAEVPMFGVAENIVKAKGSEKALAKFGTEQLKSLIPPDIKKTAKGQGPFAWMYKKVTGKDLGDVDEKGEVNKRLATNFVEELEMEVPGLRTGLELDPEEQKKKAREEIKAQLKQGYTPSEIKDQEELMQKADMEMSGLKRIAKDIELDPKVLKFKDARISKQIRLWSAMSETMKGMSYEYIKKDDLEKAIRDNPEFRKERQYIKAIEDIRKYIE